jgi:hypothetical protein
MAHAVARALLLRRDCCFDDKRVCILLCLSQAAEQKAAIERRESAKKAVDKPTEAFLQRAEAWEKQKRLRAFAAKQQPAHVNDENQPRERQRNAPKQQQTGRARQQPRQALRF